MIYSELKLPIRQDKNGKAIIDSEKKYSPEGYIPDWEYMENYIKSMHYKKITTDVKNTNIKLSTDMWKPHKLTELFTIERGNGFSKVDLEDGSDHVVNYVSRQSYNNGVNSVVDVIENVKPFDAGCITIALGGEYLGSSFVQLKPFYTGAHMAVMTPIDKKMSIYSKLFICTLIRFESKINIVHLVGN